MPPRCAARMAEWRIWPQEAEVRPEPSPCRADVTSKAAQREAIAETGLPAGARKQFKTTPLEGRERQRWASKELVVLPPLLKFGLGCAREPRNTPFPSERGRTAMVTRLPHVLSESALRLKSTRPEATWMPEIHSARV